MPALGVGTHQDASEDAVHAMARHRSQCGPGAMAWVAARPSVQELVLYAPECQLALRRAVGVETPLHSDCPHRTCPARSVDTRHARYCVRSGYVVRRHNSLRDTLQRLLQTSGIPVAVEDASYFTQTARGFRMDLTMAAGELRHGGVPDLSTHAALLDITCGDPHAPHNLLNSAMADGATAAAAASIKINHHSGSFSPASAKLWPLAVESYGRWGVEALTFFSAVAEHVCGGRHSDRFRLKGAVLHHLRQVMSVALQRDLYRSVMGYKGQVARARLGRLGVVEGQGLADADLEAAPLEPAW